MKKHSLRWGYATALYLMAWFVLWAFFSLLMLESVDMFPNEHGDGSGFARFGLMLMYLACFVFMWVNEDDVAKFHTRLMAWVSPRWDSFRAGFLNKGK